MNFRLQVGMGYTEVFEINPSQLKSINLTAALLKSLLLSSLGVLE